MNLSIKSEDLTFATPVLVMVWRFLVDNNWVYNRNTCTLEIITLIVLAMYIRP